MPNSTDIDENIAETDTKNIWTQCSTGTALGKQIIFFLYVDAVVSHSSAKVSLELFHLSRSSAPTNTNTSASWRPEIQKLKPDGK